MSTVVLDTHVLHWWSAEPERVSAPAASAIEEAERLVVAGITWYELAWLATHGRIAVSVPVDRWLRGLGEQVHTVGLTPDLAASAAALPATFPGDPADRVIYATAVHHGWSLISKDRRMREHPHPSGPTVW